MPVYICYHWKQASTAPCLPQHSGVSNSVSEWQVNVKPKCRKAACRWANWASWRAKHSNEDHNVGCKSLLPSQFYERVWEGSKIHNHKWRIWSDSPDLRGAFRDTSHIKPCSVNIHVLGEGELIFLFPVQVNKFNPIHAVYLWNSTTVLTTKTTAVMLSAAHWCSWHSPENPIRSRVKWNVHSCLCGEVPSSLLTTTLTAPGPPEVGGTWLIWVCTVCVCVCLYSVRCGDTTLQGHNVPIILIIIF